MVCYKDFLSPVLQLGAVGLVIIAYAMPLPDGEVKEQIPIWSLECSLTAFMLLAKGYKMSTASDTVLIQPSSTLVAMPYK